MSSGNKGAPQAKKRQKKTQINSIYDAKDMNDLRAYLNGRNISMSNDLDDLKFGEVRDAMAGALYVMDEFGIQGYLQEFCVGKAGVMSASHNGRISFNKKYFKDGTDDLSVVMNKPGSSFHPKNQNAFTTASHEAGHILESYIIKKELGILNNPSPDIYSQIESSNAWSKSKYTKQIISKASASAKKEYKKQQGNTPTIENMIADVSGYATKNRSECFAECIADYVANGDNASILSKEVWKYTKNYFGK